MEEFKGKKDSKFQEGAWMRPDLDEKPTFKKRSPYSGHVKDGIAHGLGTIRGGKLQPREDRKGGVEQSWQYDGTFINGQMHGYGRLAYHSESSYYEGEFHDGKPHGFGKCVL